VCFSFLLSVCLCFGRLAAAATRRGETEGNEGETDEEHKGRFNQLFLGE
jgi:hypothetical protein